MPSYATSPGAVAAIQGSERQIVSIGGALDAYAQLHRLAPIADELRERLPDTQLVVAGSTAGSGAVAHELRRLQRAGATVVEAPLDARSHGALVAASDAVLAPVSVQATFIPIEQFGRDLSTPVLVADCPGRSTGLPVDWQDPSAVVETIVELGRNDTAVTDTPEQSDPDITFGVLLEQLT